MDEVTLERTRQAVYQVDGQRLEMGTPGFANAIAAAHAARVRPRCLCVADGVEMYVARLGAGYIVKRMPDTGCRHAADCASYEPPADLSGLGQVLGSAIVEDPATGETNLRLAFPMTKLGGRSTVPAPGNPGDSVKSDGTRLSLRGLLHYLWDQAGLTHWQPGFAGKRSWATVRRHLLAAADGKIAKGDALARRLYVPEVFSVDQRDAINARRLAQWAGATAPPGKPQHLLLMVAEVKEIVPARFGFRAIVKHVPDQAFALDGALYRRLGRCFDADLTLWGASDEVHMVMIATLGIGPGGLPNLVEVSMMPVTAQWLPVADSFELQLVGRLVREGRAFVKGLRYQLEVGRETACAVLTDVAEEPVAMWISHDDDGDILDSLVNGGERGDSRRWVWRTLACSAPSLPALHRRRRRDSQMD